jgi:hypothetical protein
MLKLRDSDKFKKEYNTYKKVVDTITVETAQQHGYQLLNQLQTLGLIIEQAHDTQSHPVIDPRNTRDTIIKMIEVRKELAQLVKDAQR